MSRGRKPIKYIKSEAKAAYAESFFKKHQELVLRSARTENPNLTDVQAKQMFIDELANQPNHFQSTAEIEHKARRILAGYRGEDTDLLEAIHDVKTQAKDLGISLRGANLQSKKVNLEGRTVTLDEGIDYRGIDSDLVETYFDVTSYYTIPTNPNYVIAEGFLYYLAGDNKKKSPQNYTKIIPRSYLNE